MVLSLDVEVSIDDKENGFLKILQEIRPKWEQEAISFNKLIGGNTNILFACRHQHDEEDVIVMKIYGYLSDLVVDRESEIKTIELLHQHGRSPPIYCRFTNGIAYGYIPGEVLTWDNLKDLHYGKMIAKEFANFHNVPLAPNTQPEIFNVLRQYLDVMPSSFPDQEQQKLFKKFPSKDNLKCQITAMEEKIKKISPLVVFCHNDVIFSNVIQNKVEGTVKFIDHEYAFPNYRSFDIADHFCEYSGLETYDGFYPSKEDQIPWLKAYLESFNRLVGKPEPSEDDVLKLYKEVDMFAMIPDLFWCMWAMFQARHDNGNVDFFNYSLIRIEIGYLKKLARVYPEIYEKHLSFQNSEIQSVNN